MISKIIKEKSCIMVQVPHNTELCFISKTGKSIVCAIKGTYLDYKGYVRGLDGSMSGYVHYKLQEPVKVLNKRTYTKGSFIEYCFHDHDVKVTTVKIDIIL